MDDAEVNDRISLGSETSVNKTIHPIVQIESGVIRVPARLILGIMLEQLRIPEAIYRQRRYLHGVFSVTVLFSTSARIGDMISPQMKITGVRSSSLEIAEDSAAVEDIRYLENATNTVVKDLNYARLQRMERDNSYLRLRLNEAAEIVDKLYTNCLVAFRFMCSFSDQLHNVIANAFSPARVIDNHTNTTLMNIEVIAHELTDQGNKLEKDLCIIKRQSQTQEHEPFAPLYRW